MYTTARKEKSPSGFLRSGPGLEMDFDERVRRKNAFDASLVYGTRNFNLLTGRDKYAEYRKRIDGSWIDPKTGRLDERVAAYRTCVVCGADDSALAFVKSGFSHVRCKTCGLLYVNPMLSSGEHAEAYDKEGIYERVLESEEQMKMNRLEYNYYLDVIQMYLDKKEHIKICDIGCGPGDLLVEAKKRGFTVLGIEPHPPSHRALTERQINFIPEYFPLKEPLQTKFDCVFFLNTIEHIKNPGAFIEKMSELLEPGGLIYLSTPNLDAVSNRILHEKAGAFGGHTHLQIFDRNTLPRLVERTGLEVLEVDTVITELGTVKNYLSYKDPYFGDGADEEALAFLTPSLIYHHHLGRSLNLLARRKD